MKVIRIWISAIALVVSVQAFGQQYSTSILYNINIPVSNTADYIDQASYRGVSISPRIFFNDKVSLGVLAGWHVFYQKMAPQTYEQGDLTLYGTQFRYINAFPLYLSPQVHLGGQSKIKPYAGLGVGTTYFRQTTQMGLYESRDNKWLLGLYPEVGLTFPVRDDWHLNLNGKYNYLFQSGDFPTQGYWGIGIGLTHYFRGYRRF